MEGNILMLYNSDNKTITTNRLLLRLFEKTDAADVANLCNNYNIYKSTMYLPYPYKLEDALTWIERHVDNFEAQKSYEFAITDKETGELYGAGALSHNHHYNNGELAYWVGEEFWGNGYATEAAEALILFAFKVKNYHKVFARYFASNPASGKVMEKLGMKKEGLLLDHIRKNDRYENLLHYGILNPYE
jgi:[ribosomal protein S5]-alanine N-acetyltransferase